MAGTERTKYGVERYFLLTVALSFIGWLFETTFVFLQTGRVYHQGFLNTPICPIYGTAILAAYLLLGTPDEPRGALKFAQGKALRYALYLLVAFLIPSVFELVVGLFFKRRFGLMLWSYSGIPMNLYGVVCLPVSLAWSGLLFAFMKFAFLPIKNAVAKIPTTAAWIVTALFVALTLFDFLYNLSVL